MADESLVELVARHLFVADAECIDPAAMWLTLPDGPWHWEGYEMDGKSYYRSMVRSVLDALERAGCDLPPPPAAEG